MDGLRVELWQTKRIAEDLDAKLLEAEKLQAAVQRYLDGELTDEEFFRLADHITNPGASKQHDASD
jgi:hemolysin activation/secretion protein